MPRAGGPHHRIPLSIGADLNRDKKMAEMERKMAEIDSSLIQQSDIFRVPPELAMTNGE